MISLVGSCDGNVLDGALLAGAGAGAAAATLGLVHPDREYASQLLTKLHFTNQ